MCCVRHALDALLELLDVSGSALSISQLHCDCWCSCVVSGMRVLAGSSSVVAWFSRLTAVFTLVSAQHRPRPRVDRIRAHTMHSTA